MHTVVIDGVSSSWSKLTSGVSQGSILRPIFFVFIIDLPDVVLPCNITALYDDDCNEMLKYYCRCLKTCQQT